MTKLTLALTMAVTLTFAPVPGRALDAADLRELRAESLGEAMTQAQLERADVQRLLQELRGLQKQIRHVKVRMATGHALRDVTLVVSASLAVASGWLFYGSGGTRGAITFAIKFFSGTGVGNALLGSAIALGGLAGYKQYVITVDPEKLALLENNLAATKRHLERRAEALDR